MACHLAADQVLHSTGYVSGDEMNFFVFFSEKRHYCIISFACSLLLFLSCGLLYDSYLFLPFCIACFCRFPFGTVVLLSQLLQNCPVLMMDKRYILRSSKAMITGGQGNDIDFSLLDYLASYHQAR
jgi:hypothetical protein